MARPTKICEDHITILNEYIEECGNEWEEYTKSESTTQHGGSESFGHRLNVKLPSYAGLYLKYSRHARKEKLFNFRITETTMKDWKNKGIEILDRIEKEELSIEEDFDDVSRLLVEFSASLVELKKLQEEMLLEGGVSNQYGQVVSKLLLSANHGYKEKSETDVKHSGSVDLGGFFGSKENEDKKESLVG